MEAFLYFVECKRYSPPRKVGVAVVRSLSGVVERKRATGGMIATTSFLTGPAEEFRQDLQYRMQVADFNKLKQWIASDWLSQ